MTRHPLHFRSSVYSHDFRTVAVRAAAAIVLLALLFVARAAAAQSEPSPQVGAWEAIRTQLYGDREIGEVDENLMHIEAPANTPDAAATPVTLHFGAAAAGKISRVRVIIDNNPSPLAGTFTVAATTPIDELDLRLRIDRFTSVRAIAEMSDGSLEMRSTWVKAAGGCSAPGSAAGEGSPGEIRFRPSPDSKAMLVSIRHPNHSGFQIDPRSGDPIPPHYIHHVRLSAGGNIVLEADTGISMSENPSLRIVGVDALPAPLVFEAVDTKDAHFSASWNGSAASSGMR
jgi:sulfur-oxidizing protein SoxY